MWAAGGALSHPGHPCIDQCVACIEFANGHVASWIQGDAGLGQFTGKFFFELFGDGRTVQLYDRLKQATLYTGRFIHCNLQVTYRCNFKCQICDFWKQPHEAGRELTVTLSTRTLVRWARLALTFKGAPQPLAYTLDQALTARAEPEQREAIHRIAADVFGSLWTGTAP